MRLTRPALTLALILIVASALVASTAGTRSAGPSPSSKFDARLTATLASPHASSSRFNTAFTSTAAAEANEIGVLIQFSGDPAVLETTGARIGTIAGDIATAYATPEQVHAIATLPSVVRMAAGAQRQSSGDLPPLTSPDSLRRLDESVDTTGVDIWHGLGYDGTGVIVGVVDTGLDYKHPAFRTGDDDEPSTRVLRIWDQLDVGGPHPQGFAYGTEWTSPTMEADIADPLCPPLCDVRQKDTEGHGTHVTSIAAGDGSAAMDGAFAGMAPNAHIVHVKSPLSDPQIIDGAAYIFQMAAQMGVPAVVNLSIGGLDGSHDGTSLFESALTALVGEPGRAMVTAAGNEGNARVHAGADIPPAGSIDITFDLPTGLSAQKVGSDLFNFWYDGPADLCFTLTSPNGYTNVPGCLGDNILTHTTPDGCIGITSTGPEPNGDNEALVFVDGPQNGCANDAKAGKWTIRVAANAGSSGARVDGWSVPGNHQFDPPYGDTQRTITEPGSAPDLITVGSFITKACWDSKIGEFCANPPVQQGDISDFSSRGPNRVGDIKPDISAPGQRVFAAFSDEAFPPSLSVVSPDSNYIGIQGTSMASPHVAGAAALILQAHPDWTQEQVKSALLSSSLQDPFTGSANNTWGAGKLNMPPPPLVKGDLNCDDKVQPTDGLAILSYIAALGEGSACIAIGAIAGVIVFGDIDCDLDVDAVDALLILKYIAALPIELAFGCAPLGEAP